MLHKKHENRLVELALEYLDLKGAEEAKPEDAREQNQEDAEKPKLFTWKKSGETTQKTTTSTTVGKVASFGPTVIQIGLKPTLLFYQDEKRRFVTSALYEILQMAAEDKELREDLVICQIFAKKAADKKDKTLLDCLNDIDTKNTKDENEKHAKLVEARELICAASTALKWALRSLKVEKTDGD